MCMLYIKTADLAASLIGQNLDGCDMGERGYAVRLADSSGSSVRSVTGSWYGIKYTNE